MFRSVLAVVAGVVAGGVIVAAGELAGQLVFPPPAGMDPMDPASVAAAMASIPIGALLVILASWNAGSFGGGFLAARLARRAPLTHATIVGGVFLLAGVANMVAIPHPIWFWIAALVTVLPAGYCAGRLAGRRAGEGAGMIGR